MHDSDLARRARAALAEARDATLLIQRPDGPAHLASAVVLHENGGRPRLVCEAGSSVRTAAQSGRRAILRVADGTDGSAATFTGPLAVEAIETIDGCAFYIIGMRLRSVFVAQREIALDAYIECDADLLEHYAQRLRSHTNGTHAGELRRVVARWEGLPESEIAAAHLAEIDPARTVIEWVDSRGSHSRGLDFPKLARSAVELSQALRAQLRR
jgi:hypothetical protein